MAVVMVEEHDSDETPNDYDVWVITNRAELRDVFDHKPPRRLLFEVPRSALYPVCPGLTAESFT